MLRAPTTLTRGRRAYKDTVIKNVSFALVNTSTGQKVLAASHLSLLVMQIGDEISMKLPPVNATVTAISCQLICYTRH